MSATHSYAVTGRLADQQTVALDEPLPIKEGKVRVVIEPIDTTSRPYAEVMSSIRARQQQRGHQPATREEVDSQIQAERSGWGE